MDINSKLNQVSKMQLLLVTCSLVFSLSSIAFFIYYITNEKNGLVLYISLFLACLSYICGVFNINFGANTISTTNFLLGSFFYVIMFTFIIIISTNSLVPFTPDISFNPISNVETHKTIFRATNPLTTTNIPFGNYVGENNQSEFVNVSPGTTGVGFRFMGTNIDKFEPQVLFQIGFESVSPGVTGCTKVENGWECGITGVTGIVPSFAPQLELNENSKLQWKHDETMMGFHVQRYESPYSIKVENDGVFAFLLQQDKSKMPFNLGYLCSMNNRIQQSWSLYPNIDFSSNKISLKDNSLPMDRFVLWSFTKESTKEQKTIA